MTRLAVGSITGGDEADSELMKDSLSQATPFQELGVSGLKRAGGYLDEEFLPQLKGKKAIQIYREMSDNDPIVGALLFSIDKLIRNADWEVMPGGKTREHTNAAKLVETAKDDMSHSWDEMLSEILSSLIYGWDVQEIVYKRRMGPWQKDGRQRSKYSDGLIGWRKIPTRAQETLQRWAFDSTGGIKGMVQLGPPEYQVRNLPIERLLLFRYGQHKGSPEGRSMLRNAYRPWFYKKRMEEHEAIGVERDLAGLPIVKVPAAWLRAKPGSDQYKQVEAFKKMIRGIRRNEQEGVVFPQAFDDEAKKEMFSLELLGSGGSRQFQTDTIITRLEQRILMTVLADFIMVGHQRVGTYNLHLDKTGIFRTALNATVDSVADIFNRHAIPRLFAINGWKPAELPTFRVNSVDAPDIGQLAAFLTATAGVGFTWGPDEEMEKYLRAAAGLPPMTPDDEKASRSSSRRVEATRMAEEQTALLAARSALAQQMAATQMEAMGVPSPEEAQMMAGQRQQQEQSAAQGEQAQVDNARADQEGQLKAKVAQVDMKTKVMDAGTRRLAAKNKPKPKAGGK